MNLNIQPIGIAERMCNLCNSQEDTPPITAINSWGYIADKTYDDHKIIWMVDSDDSFHIGYFTESTVDLDCITMNDITIIEADIYQF